MNKPEYSDLYKFLASLGVIIISISLLLPWLFLTQSFNSLISNGEIIKYTQTAQTLINLQQTTALWFIKNLLIICTILFLLGCSLLVYSLHLWKPVQDEIDRERKLSNQKLSNELKTATKEEQFNKFVQEVSENNEEHEETIKDFSTQISKYISVEEKVLNKLAISFGENNVLRNKLIGKKQVDAIIRISPSIRAVIEIKYLTNENNLEKIANAITSQLYSFTKEYKEIRNSINIFGVGIIITSNIIRSDGQVANNKSHDCLIFSEEQLATLSNDEFRILIIDVMQKQKKTFFTPS